jgi:LPS sulfotransferase NodH
VSSTGQLSAPARLVNALGAAAGPRPDLTPERLLAAASQRTGLRDFGDPWFRAGLDVLLASLEHDASLHFAGRLMMRRLIVDNLVNRLLVTDLQRRAAGVFARPLVPPLIVVGLPRSGTTLLHRLLAAGPGHYGPPYWELAQPLPRPGRPDLRRGYGALLLELRKAVHSDLDRKHFMAAGEPEEDMFLLGPTFDTWLYWLSAPVFGYLDWYRAQDHRAKYAEYRAWLQVLQAAHPGQRLVLKSPEHTGGLAALRAAVPEAQLIQLQRDPATAFASYASLTRTTQAIFASRVDPARTARASLALFAAELRGNRAARAQAPGAVLDVDYDDLVAAPAATVRGVYRHFGLAWTGAAAAGVRRHLAQNPPGRHGVHRYQLDSGLTAAQVRAALAAP